MSNKCKFGTGQQITHDCDYLYVHVFGYYPTKELYKEALRMFCPNYMKTKSPDPKATISDPFTFGKSRAAQDLVAELQAIEEPRLRKYNIKTVQTIISRCGLGVGELTNVEHPHIRFELLVLWRKFWLETINKNKLAPKVRTRVRSIIVERTRNGMRNASAEIREEKELRKLEEEYFHDNP